MAKTDAGVQRGNTAVAENAAYRNNVLNATITGTTDTAVVRFNAAGGISSTDWLNEVGVLADNGTVVALREPGFYLVEGYLQLDEDGDAVVAISFGQASNFTAATVPVFNAFGVIAVRAALAPVATTIPMPLTAIVAVTQTIARTAPGLTAPHNVRLLATLDSEGGQVTEIDLTRATLRITKISDLAF